jgi:hypothetical protein
MAALDLVFIDVATESLDFLSGDFFRVVVFAVWALVVVGRFVAAGLTALLWGLAAAFIFVGAALNLSRVVAFAFDAADSVRALLVALVFVAAVPAFDLA